MNRELPPVSIASPCSRNWDEMAGDHRKRYCAHCSLHVHDLTEMSRRERRQFFSATGGKACVTYLAKKDGTPVTRGFWSSLWQPILRKYRRLLTAIMPGALVALLGGCRSPHAVRLTGAPLPVDNTETVRVEADKK